MKSPCLSLRGALVLVEPAGVLADSPVGLAANVDNPWAFEGAAPTSLTGRDGDGRSSGSDSILSIA